MKDKDLLDAIDHAETLEELMRVRISLLADIKDSFADTMMGKKEVFFLKEFYARLYQRVIKITLGELEAEGKSVPSSCRFSFILLGSGGRDELTLSSDQDHMVLFPDGEELSEDEEIFFAHLMQRISVSMVKLGLPLCEGNVLATNRKWRLTESQLKMLIDQWFAQNDWKQVREFIILYDMKRVYGDADSIERIRKFIFRKLEENPLFLERIYENMKKNEIPLTSLGRVSTLMHGSYHGAISIKQGMYLPLVKSIRLLAIGEKIDATSTLDRIDALVEHGFWKKEKGEFWANLFFKIFTFRHSCPKRFHISDGERLPYSKLPFNEQKEVREMLRSLLHLKKEVERYIRHKMNERRGVK